MKTQFEPLVLEKLKELFRDEQAYQAFQDKIIASLSTGCSPVFAAGRILGFAVSTENGKELIYQKVVEQWAKNPQLLDDLQRSIESEDLVAAPELEEAGALPSSECKTETRH